MCIIYCILAVGYLEKGNVINIKKIISKKKIHLQYLLKKSAYT